MKRRLVLVLIAATGLFALWSVDALYRTEIDNDNRAALHDAAEDTSRSLETALLARTVAVRDLGAFLLASPALPDRAAFDRYAGSVLEHVPDLRALQYADPDLVIVNVYPLEGNEAALGLDVTQSPAAADALAAMETRQMTLGDPFNLAQGPLGTVIRVPLYRDDTFLGLAQGVIEVEPWLAQISAELDDGFAMHLQGNDGEVFWGPDTLSGETQSVSIEAGIGTWTMTVGWAQGAPPTAPFVRAGLWALGTALLASLLLFVHRMLTHAERLEKAVAKRTAELSQSERRYRTLVEQAQDAILIVDGDGNYLDANRAALQMLGYEREELLAMNARDILAPFEQNKPLRFAEVARGESILSERWLRRKDGNLILAESSGKMLPDGRFLGIIRDVTDRRAAEEALGRAEAILQAVSFAAAQFLRSGSWQQQMNEVLARLGEAAGVSRVYIFQNERGADGKLLAHYRYEWAAPGISRQLGDPDLQALPYEEAGAQSWEETLSRGDIVSGAVEQFDSPMREILAAQEIVSLAAVPIFAGDVWWGFMGYDDCRRVRTWSEVEIDALRAAADNLGAAISNAELLEETQRLLKQTREQTRQMQQIMEAAPDGVILLDARQKILLANPAARDYLARLNESAIGDVLERVGARQFKELAGAGQEAGQWRELQAQDAGEVFEGTARPVESGGETVGWVLIIRDVTAERQRQAFLQRQDRLATVGQLAAGIAHDFNNIMSVMTLYSESLQRNPDDARRDVYLQTIHDQARYAADLITQILDFSRKAVMERGRLDLLPFVEQIVRLLQRTLPETIALHFEAEEGNYVVQADPTRLQQVLMNLAVNARDAMPGGGALRIRLSQTTILTGQRPPLPEMAPGDWIRLTVRDSGSGIASEHLSHIFEPFFTTKEVGKGTGLGLAQVYGIVKQHGGEIDVQSEPGAGATFTIYLPKTASPPPTRDAADKERNVTPAPAQETILLVEDNALTREAIGDTLEMSGYRIFVAGTGRQALALFEEHGSEIDLVLSDVYMPEMGGVELYRRLKDVDPGVRMMLMTGYPLEDGGRALLEEGIVTWIRKPFTQAEIVARLRAVLGDAEA